MEPLKPEEVSSAPAQETADEFKELLGQRVAGLAVRFAQAARLEAVTI